MHYLHHSNGVKASGHYAPAVSYGELVYISAHLPIHPQTGEHLHGNVAAQTLQILENIESLLSTSGGNRNSIIKTTVFITDITQWGEVDQAYVHFFSEHTPARSVVEVSGLHFGFKVAIEAVAVMQMG